MTLATTCLLSFDPGILPANNERSSCEHSTRIIHVIQHFRLLYDQRKCPALIVWNRLIWQF